MVSPKLNIRHISQFSTFRHFYRFYNINLQKNCGQFEL